ncbi:Serpentine Receptor, class H [Caenorhabditis elegans]|uniref:Serpentine Receptor, class H n=1 Tax=Caenorhabditis elegans TaxID=6239 RepID=Q9XU52_CAEEL|nr:Serpentine Receptor, class H [Caenorhabditis elegans]CAB05795.1 Serpentine Receptor, class H [Caenorhabditis elegans]|eukprot:NP_507159.1 Serpentine Receptor, class H [Caenorhabditis elegans]
MSCTYRRSFLESDLFYTISLHSLSAIHIPLHIFGAYIILKKTPKEMARVKISMLVMHLTFAWLDIYNSVLSIPIFIVPIFSGYPLGLLYYSRVPTWFITYLGFTSVFLTIPAMIMFFENRYNYLVRTDYMTKSRKIKRAVYYSILYIASISTFITPLMKVPNVTKTRAIARLKYPCLPREIVNNPRLFVLACANTVIICFFTFLFIGWIQVVGFFLATAINIHKGKTLSKKASQMQKQFFIALCIQFSVPLIVVLIPESYLIYSAVTKNLDIALTNISMICFSTHGLFSTIVMLVVHKPYRQATLQILKIKRIEKIGTANKVFLVFQEKKQVSKSMKKSSF